MSEFDKIIGYNTIKKELCQICDIVNNPENYTRLGGKIPKGLLLHGVPGVGKSMMAKALMAEMRRKTYTVRRNSPDGDFIRQLNDCFRRAAETSPSVILLDDMDKFSENEDSRQEFSALQACIDEVTEKDVFVIATVNSMHEIPDSLLRSGRFDLKIEVTVPVGKTATEIIKYYLQDKPIADSVNMEDIAKMLYGNSCATLESIMNGAAILAGYEKQDKISTSHIVKAFFQQEHPDYMQEFDSSYMDSVSKEQLEDILFHEAGHIVALETLAPGSVGFAYINPEYDSFIRQCRELRGKDKNILVSVAGMAATEIQLGIKTKGASKDIDDAIFQLRYSVTNDCCFGNSYIDPFDQPFEHSTSAFHRFEQELAIRHEFERYLMTAKQMMAENRELLCQVAEALRTKRILMYSDIRNIFDNVKTA